MYKVFTNFAEFNREVKEAGLNLKVKELKKFPRPFRFYSQLVLKDKETKSTF